MQNKKQKQTVQAKPKTQTTKRAERDGEDESADDAVTMLMAAVGVQLLGSETEETNLGTVLLPCYLLLSCSCWGGGAAERDCGDESADGAGTMLFAGVSARDVLTSFFRDTAIDDRQCSHARSASR